MEQTFTNNQLKIAPRSQTEDYILPNELHPGNAQPIFDKITNGVYISVGAERGFISASLTNASHLLLADLDPRVVLYNRTKIGVISISKDIEDLRYLLLKASHKEWCERVNKYEGFLDTEIKNAVLDEELFGFVKSKSRNDDGLFVLFSSDPEELSGSPFKNANYHFYKDQYKKLKAMTEKGNISADLVDITNKELMIKIAGNIAEKGLKIGAVDISNAWQYDEVSLKLENILLSPQSALDEKSILILTNVTGRGFESYLGFYFDYLANNLNTVHRLPRTLAYLTSTPLSYINNTDIPATTKNEFMKYASDWNRQTAIFNPDILSTDYLLSATNEIKAAPVTKFTTADILINGFSADRNIRKQEIDHLLKDFVNANYKTKTVITSMLNTVSPNEVTKDQRQNIININNNVQSYLIVSENAFNEKEFILKARMYSKDHNPKRLTASYLAEESIKTFVKKFNSRCNREPLDKIITTKDLSFLAGPNGYLEYLIYRINDLNEPRQKNAAIVSLHILVEIIKMVPNELWDTPFTPNKKDFLDINRKMDFFVEEKISDPQSRELRELLDWYTTTNKTGMKNSLEFITIKRF